MIALRQEPPTPTAMLAASNVEAVVIIENLWEDVRGQIRDVQDLTDSTSNPAVKIALTKVKDRLESAIKALYDAGLTARGMK